MPIRKIAHRGFSQLYGDNNLTSFRKSIDAGFDMIELDIQLCKSKEIIVYHDTYYKDKLINEYTYRELFLENIITLEYVLRNIEIDRTSLFFDIKGDDKAIARPLYKLIVKYIPKAKMGRIYISGFGRNWVKYFTQINHKMMAPVNLGFTTENKFSWEHLDILMRKMSFYCVHWTALDHEHVKQLKKKGVKVFSYTCKNQMILDYMNRFNLDGIISNDFII